MQRDYRDNILTDYTSVNTTISCGADGYSQAIGLPSNNFVSIKLIGSTSDDFSVKGILDSNNGIKPQHTNYEVLTDDSGLTCFKVNDPALTFDVTKYTRLILYFPSGTSNTTLYLKGIDGASTKYNVVQLDGSAQLDSFGRLRVSEAFTIFDLKHIAGKRPDICDEELNGSATSVWDEANSAILMYVAADGDYAISQTKMKFNYQPAKATAIFNTADLFDVKSNIIKRVGYFNTINPGQAAPYDGYNGIYFESDGYVNNNVAVVVLRNGVANRVAQSDWNIDKMDGTGPSGITVDWNKSQIFMMDFQWLGTGRVRFGLSHNGIIHYCHYFNHANNINGTYMQTPNLPIRHEIRSYGGKGYLRKICSSVQSESPVQYTGKLRTFSTGNSYINLDGAGTLYPILILRLQEVADDVSILIDSINMLAQTSDYFRWFVSFNPTFSSTPTYTAIPNSSLEGMSNTGATITLTDIGETIAEGYAAAQTRQVSETVENAIRLGETIAGVHDVIVLGAVGLTAGAHVYASVSFRELL